MIAAVSSMTPDDAYTLLKVLLAMWQSRFVSFGTMEWNQERLEWNGNME